MECGEARLQMCMYRVSFCWNFPEDSIYFACDTFVPHLQLWGANQVFGKTNSTCSFLKSPKKRSVSIPTDSSRGVASHGVFLSFPNCQLPSPEHLRGRGEKVSLERRWVIVWKPEQSDLVVGSPSNTWHVSVHRSRDFSARFNLPLRPRSVQE